MTNTNHIYLVQTIHGKQKPKKPEDVKITTDVYATYDKANKALKAQYKKRLDDLLITDEERAKRQKQCNTQGRYEIIYISKREGLFEAAQIISKTIQ